VKEIGAQFGIFGVTVAFLCIKWIFCTGGAAPRALNVFMKDNLKQVLGWGVIHALNEYSTIEMEDGVRKTKGSHLDECDWYWVTIVIDTTLGTLFLYWLLQMSKMLLSKTGNLQARNVAQFGNYKGVGARHDWQILALQTLLWVILVALMKGSMMCIIDVGSGKIDDWLSPVTVVFQCRADLKLLVAVVITPALMNTMQFLIVDRIIENKHGSFPYMTHSSLSPYMVSRKCPYMVAPYSVSPYIVSPYTVSKPSSRQQTISTGGDVVISTVEPSPLTQALLPTFTPPRLHLSPLNPTSPQLPPTPPMSEYESSVTSPRNVETYLDLRDFGTYSTHVCGMDKNDFIKFSAKNPDFAAYHGFDQLDNEEKEAFFGFIAEGNPTVTLQNVETALLDQANLVHIFNNFLDIRQGGGFNLGEFRKACKQNDALAELFKVKDDEGNTDMDKIRTCFNNMADVYSFAGLERTVRFKQLHKILHSGYHKIYTNPQELRQKIKKVVEDW